MKKCGMYKLKIDPEFELMIPPLSDTQYEKLEIDIFDNGCKEPLLIWNDTIIDGHKRYNICKKWEIPFQTDELEFDSHEDALIWVCQTQLQRPKLNAEYKKYLIGKMYDAEVLIGIRNPQENECSETSSRLNKHGEPMNKYKTAIKIGNDYNISHVTVYKYSQYSAALDILLEKSRNLVKRILTGNLKISHNNLVELSRLTKEHLTMLSSYLNDEQLTHVSYSQMRHELQWKKISTASETPITHRHKPEPLPKIRNMPKPDPDAEISSLTYTIPYWINSIERTNTVANFPSASTEAKNRLRYQLAVLKKTIEKIQKTIEEAI